MNTAWRALLFLLLPSLALAGSPDYLWSISASSTDPFANTDPPSGALETLYVWIVPTDGGFTTGEMALEIMGIQVLLFHSPGPITLEGTFDNFRITTPSCTTVPTIVARLEIRDFAGWICQVPIADAQYCVTDCAVDPTPYESSFTGFTSDGSDPCSIVGEGVCMPLGIDETVVHDSWGNVKESYRR